MNKRLKTYNFLISCGKIAFQLDINAYTEDEAIDIVLEQYPQNSGFTYILL